MNLQVVQNLDQYLEIIKKFKNDNEVSWFRGASKACYRLIPSLYRDLSQVGLEYSGRMFEEERMTKSSALLKEDLCFIEDFEKKYKALEPSKSKDFKLMDYLYIMQHYDIPTRLLDFSSCDKVALYFAVGSSQFNDITEDVNTEIEQFKEDSIGLTESGSTIYCINPAIVNKESSIFKMSNNDSILDFKDMTRELISKIDSPICISTNNADDRIKAQKGKFVFFGYMYNPLDHYEIISKDITKIFIPNSCRYSIKKELEERFNISHQTIYPDIKGLALNITEKMNEKYVKNCIGFFGEQWPNY